MPVIDFYHLAGSPPCRAVEMVASLVGVELKKHVIDLSKGDQFKEDYVKLNPLHKVPFIVDGEVKIGESRAILAYLVNKYQPNNEHLYPKGAECRAKIDEFLYYEMGTFYSSAYKLFRPMFMGKVDRLNEDDEKAFKTGLDYLEKRLADSKANFMCGNHLSIADISLAASLTMPTCCDYDLSPYKNLLAYMGRVRAAVPKYGEINDGPCEMFKQRVAQMQQKQ